MDDIKRVREERDDKGGVILSLEAEIQLLKDTYVREKVDKESQASSASAIRGKVIRQAPSNAADNSPSGSHRDSRGRIAGKSGSMQR